MSSQLIVCFGEMLIDFVPDVSGVSLAESTGFLKAPGGAPANVACAITKLGGSSAFVGKVHPLPPFLSSACFKRPCLQGLYIIPPPPTT